MCARSRMRWVSMLSTRHCARRRAGPAAAKRPLLSVLMGTAAGPPLLLKAGPAAPAAVCERSGSGLAAGGYYMIGVR